MVLSTTRAQCFNSLMRIKYDDFEIEDDYKSYLSEVSYQFVQNLLIAFLVGVLYKFQVPTDKQEMLRGKKKKKKGKKTMHFISIYSDRKRCKHFTGLNPDQFDSLSKFVGPAKYFLATIKLLHKLARYFKKVGLVVVLDLKIVIFNSH